MALRKPIQGWSLALSVGVHTLLAAGALMLAVRGLDKEAERERERQAEAARAAAAGQVSISLEPWHERIGVAPTPAGGAAVARIDTGQAGTGGERASERARHLADRDDDLRATPESTTLHADDQVQRLASAKKRSSWEDRRSTTRPMQLSFVTTGKGRELDRRPSGERDPARGVLIAGLPQTRGEGAPGSEFAAGDGAASSGKLASDHAGAEAGGHASPGIGTRNGLTEAERRASARLAFARPDIPLAVVSVNSETRGRVMDDVDSRQSVASVDDAIVQASPNGGEQGAGRGGSYGSGAPGSGAAIGVGSHARPFGAGAGDWIDLDTTDPSLASYCRSIREKTNPVIERSFPEQARLDLKQGFLIAELLINSDGTIEPRLVRGSGIDEYDRNFMAAIRRIALAPIPQRIGRSSLRVRGRFEAMNPVIK